MSLLTGPACPEARKSAPPYPPTPPTHAHLEVPVYQAAPQTPIAQYDEAAQRVHVLAVRIQYTVVLQNAVAGCRVGMGGGVPLSSKGIGVGSGEEGRGKSG
jgi:hypothetical protein